MIRPMELLSVRCNHCGAPLEVGTQTKFVTCQFCQSQLEVKHTGSSTFTEVVEQIAANTAQMAGNLKVIEIQNELERLDREWNGEREQYYVTGKNGQRSKPSVLAAICAAVFIVPFGIFFAATSSQAGAPFIFPLFGIGFVVLAIVSIGSSLMKAEGLSRSESGYQTRRAELLRQLDQARNARR
jgi:hypothetical protein